MIPSEYEGREQTYIKHEFLTRYLKKLAFKVLISRSDILNYVDAFAGPWGNLDNNSLSDTSFDLALRTLDVVKDKLETLNRPRKIRFCFCEKNNQSFQKLKNYADEHNEYDINIFQGKFEENLENISNYCQTGFTFTFIDPTGWKIDSESILKFLKDQNGEFLINFMAEHINRHATYAQVSKSIGLFLANPKWEPEFQQLSNEWNNEQRILTLLKQKIKDTGTAKYTPDFSIQKPRANQVKMRLLLGTNSPFGLELFRDVQEQVEKKEIETRTTVQNKGLNSLFDNTNVLNELEGIGSKKFKEEAEKRIQKLFIQKHQLPFRDIHSNILENDSITLKELNESLKKMKQHGEINYQLPPKKRILQMDTMITKINSLL